MKKYLLAFALLLALFNVNAQTQTQTVKRLSLNQTSVVKDSSGMVFPYFVWQKMMQTGNYTVKPENYKDENTAFIIIHLTAAQKDERMSKLSRPGESKFFTTGGAIKPFKVKDITGKKVEAKDWAGKTIVLNFWFIGCPPCRQEMPELNKVVTNFANNPNVLFIGIALDEDYDVKEFIKNNPFNYRLVGDGRFYASIFGINLYPTNVVIDREGKVRFHSSGYALNTPYWIEKTIKESEAGQKDL